MVLSDTYQYSCPAYLDLTSSLSDRAQMAEYLLHTTQYPQAGKNQVLRSSFGQSLARWGLLLLLATLQSQPTLASG